VGHVLDRGEVGRRVIDADPALVVAEDHAHDPMQAVLDCPMNADDRPEKDRQQDERGDVEACLPLDLVTDFPGAFGDDDGFQAGPVVAFLQPGDIVDDGGGSGLDAAVIGVNRLVTADRCVLEACGFLLGDEDLDILAQRFLIVLLCQDVVGLLVDDLLRDVALAPSSGHSIRLRLTEPLASLAHRIDGHDRPLDRRPVQ
jgi:hypothetical protein